MTNNTKLHRFHIENNTWNAHYKSFSTLIFRFLPLVHHWSLCSQWTWRDVTGPGLACRILCTCSKKLSRPGQNVDNAKFSVEFASALLTADKASFSLSGLFSEHRCLRTTCASPGLPGRWWKTSGLTSGISRSHRVSQTYAVYRMWCEVWNDIKIVSCERNTIDAHCHWCTTPAWPLRPLVSPKKSLSKDRFRFVFLKSKL